MEVTAEHFQTNLEDLCELAAVEPVVISDAGTTVAVVLSVDFYEMLVASAHSAKAETDTPGDL